MARGFWDRLIDETYGAGETALGVLGPMAGEVAGGYAGLLSGDPGAVQPVQDAFAYQPRSPEGQRNMAALGQGVQAAMDYQPPLSPTGMSLGEEVGALASGWNDAAVPMAQEYLGDEVGAGLGALGAAAAGTFGGPARSGARQGARSTLRGAQRKAYPGIYKDPDDLMRDVTVAPEDPIMQQLWGVNRGDLAETSLRQGNVPGGFPGAPANPKGSAATLPVMGGANTRRLTEALDYAKDTPMGEGMRGWYVMDPMYQRLEQMVGPEEAVRRYNQLNTLSGMASPGSDVLTEINRGSAANMLQEQGRFGDFMKYGGGMEANPPADMANVMGHVYHKTAQGLPMQKYLDTGQIQSKEPKVPLYVGASGVPETGFQTDFPVGDAHWSRAVGLGDTRTNKNFGKSFSGPEAMALQNWWKDDVAGAAGLEAVPGQATAWGLYSPQTGVKSPVGAPKLELWSQQIQKAAQREGVSPEVMRDRVLMGQGQAGFIDPKYLPWLGLLGAGSYMASNKFEEDVEGSAAAQAFKPRKIP